MMSMDAYSNVNEKSLPWVVQRKHDMLKHSVLKQVEALEERIHLQEQRYQQQQIHLQQQIQQQQQQLQQQQQQIQLLQQQLQLIMHLQEPKKPSPNSQIHIKQYEVEETQQFFKQQQERFMQELIKMRQEPEPSSTVT
jgi:hypothetical protein